MQPLSTVIRTERLFSGIQPSGQVHLGNYLGAIKNWVELSKRYHKPLFCLVDLHALTSISKFAKFKDESKILSDNVREVTKSLLASGLDPTSCTIYQQSTIPFHAHLMWILSCRTPLNILEQIPQYRTKVAEYSEKSSDFSPQLSLLTYPVLMAADILLFKASAVPVGEDQIHHLELTRKLAASFNSSANSPFFPIPNEIMTKTSRVMSFTDATKKMSKSVGTDRSRILITDPPDVMVQKVRKAKTDSVMGISYQPDERPELANLLRIYSALDEYQRSEEDIAEVYASSSSSQFKNDLADLLVAHFTPIQTQFHKLSSDNQYIDDILSKGAAEAVEIANKTLIDLHSIMGLSPILYSVNPQKL